MPQGGRLGCTQLCRLLCLAELGAHTHPLQNVIPDLSRHRHKSNLKTPAKTTCTPDSWLFCKNAKACGQGLCWCKNPSISIRVCASTLLVFDLISDTCGSWIRTNNPAPCSQSSIRNNKTKGKVFQNGDGWKAARTAQKVHSAFILSHFRVAKASLRIGTVRTILLRCTEM